MASTPTLQVIINEIRAEFGPTHVGVCNCRKTRLGGGRTGGWSHHAWCNAGDFYPDNRAQGDAMIDFLTDNRDRLSVYQILWYNRSVFTGNPVSDHRDHYHLVPWPYGINTPPCAGGTLTVRHRDGSIGHSFGESNNGPIGDEEMQLQEHIAVIQSALIEAGYDIGEWDGYVAPDGTVYPQGADGLMPMGGESWRALVSAYKDESVIGAGYVTHRDLSEHTADHTAHDEGHH